MSATAEGGRTAKLTPARISILRVAFELGSVDAYAQQRRSVEYLATRGLLKKIGLVTYVLTDAGRAALSSAKGEGQ